MNPFDSYVSPSKNEDFLKRYFFSYLFSHFSKREGMKILDVGCGDGAMLKLLQESGFDNLEGIDISKKQVQRSGLEFVKCVDPLDYLQGKTGVYDVILLIDVLEHLELEYSLDLLQNIKSSLKDGGLLLIQVPNSLCPLNPHRHGDVTHLRAYTLESLEQSLRYGGFAAWNHFSLPPLIHGIKSAVRRCLYHGCVQPLIALYLLVTTGKRWGGIYTPNFLTAVSKN